ncbi:hypothetical protein NL108_004844 [Boleophthalmus pectinirostris]|uniref:prostatic spermine-binding protein-like n=1 Tax=Boleophthalmus pectinirostris TaxID=150288 RepID=UPI00242CB1C9|nr:prostatic spermine-binding protein-like [Boleophthalmus pectinirostris]KAJ0066869.1 hypothetical protein NL108_004844 [Boleophthalmus pectinirostris]
MSFLVDKLAKRAGDMVADKIKDALGGSDDRRDDRRDKDDKHDGFLSIFKKDRDEDRDDDDHKGGLFSFGRDKDKNREKEKDKGNFFEKIFDRDDDDDDHRRQKKSGFAGLFSEQDPPGGAGLENSGTEAGPCDHMTEGDLDLMSDLMAVANETS